MENMSNGPTSNKGEDLHVAKASHMSAPLSTGVELHLNPRDVGVDCQVGKTYDVVFPMVLTSKDEGGYRFKQSGMAEVQERDINKAAKSEQATMPAKKLGLTDFMGQA